MLPTDTSNPAAKDLGFNQKHLLVRRLPACHSRSFLSISWIKGLMSERGDEVANWLSMIAKKLMLFFLGGGGGGGTCFVKKKPDYLFMELSSSTATKLFLSK